MTHRNSLPRRTFTQGLLAATVVLPGWGLAQERAKELVIGGAAGHRAFLDPLIPEFEKQTGAKVLFEGTRSLVNLEKLVSSKSRQSMSVVLMDDPVMIQAVAEGVLDKIAPSQVPNVSRLKPAAIHMDGMWVNYMQSTTGVAINTSRVKQVLSYAKMWEPAAKGKVIIPSLQNTEGLTMFIVAAMLETGKPAAQAQYQPEAAFKRLRALKPNLLTVYTQLPQALNLLEQGEVSMIGGMIGFNAFERRAKGAPIDLVLPMEGGMAMPTGLARVKGAPEPELANQFIDSMLGAWQKRIAEISLARPTNTTVADPAGLPKGDVFVPDWAYISERRKGWVERWDREMAL